jgi:DNA-binding response OmpR family regulator
MSSCTENCAENCLVVLVEDDDAIRTTFAEVLESEGYDVLAFANGRQALEGLDRRPCLILLDWMMPEMGGEQFLEARAAGTPAGETPVVVVSAVPHWVRKVPGVAGLMAKPVDLDGLLSVVRRHCRHAQAS